MKRLPSTSNCAASAPCRASLRPTPNCARSFSCNGRWIRHWDRPSLLSSGRRTTRPPACWRRPTHPCSVWTPATCWKGCGTPRRPRMKPAPRPGWTSGWGCGTPPGAPEPARPCAGPRRWKSGRSSPLPTGGSRPTTRRLRRNGERNSPSSLRRTAPSAPARRSGISSMWARFPCNGAPPGRLGLNWPGTQWGGRRSWPNCTAA